MSGFLRYWWIELLMSLAAFVVLLLFSPIVCSTGCMQIHRAFSDIDAVHIALTHFHAAHHRYPTTSEGLSVLTPGFLLRVSHDPWGNAYVYRAVKNESYALYSAGIDGLDEGGSGNDVTTRGKKYENPAYCVPSAASPRHILVYVLLSLLLAGTLTGLTRGAVKVWKNLI